jgi:integrase
MDQTIHLPGLLSSALPRRRGRARIALQVADWPPQDRVAWEHACTPVSLLADTPRPGATWRQTTRQVVAQTYGVWLAFLSSVDALPSIAHPSARLARELIDAFIDSLRESGSSSVTLATTLGRLVMAANAMWPDRDWAWLRATRATLQRQATPSRGKAGRLVSPVVLLDVGWQLMAEADAMPERLRATAARLYRDGLLIAFIALSLLRRRTVASIELGRHLHRGADGWSLHFSAADTKNDTPDVRQFPPALVPALERYLTAYRPIFAARHKGAPSVSLWLGPHGKALSALAIWQIVTRHTRARLGIAVTPHLFRDAGVTFLGDEDPEHVRMGACLLGHSSFRTTERHYILAQSRNALRRHQAAITAERAALRRRRSKSSVEADDS